MSSFRDLHHTDDTLGRGKRTALSCLQIPLSARFCLHNPSGLFHTTFHRVPGGEHLGEFISFKDLHLCSILPPSFFNYTVMFWKAWALSFLLMLQRLPHLKVADTPKVTWNGSSLLFFRIAVLFFMQTGVLVRSALGYKWQKLDSNLLGLTLIVRTDESSYM